MSYGNWGAFVYRNDGRQPNHEDQTPYRENELVAGYQQAFMRQTDGLNPHHAVLGQSRVRLCGYKDQPVLFLDGKEVSMEPFLVPETTPDDAEWQGAIEGYVFHAKHDADTNNRIVLELIEPDGTKWTAICGYSYGAGHMD